MLCFPLRISPWSPAEYDEVLESYVPAVMAMASVYWDREQYGAVQAALSQASEFCSEHEVWRLNVAHTFFMQVRFVRCCRR